MRHVPSFTVTLAFATAATLSGAAPVEPGMARRYLTFDYLGLIPIESYRSDVKLDRAVLLASKGDWKGARAIFQELIRANPGDLAARRGEAEAAERLGTAAALKARLSAEAKKKVWDYAVRYEIGMLEMKDGLSGPIGKRKGAPTVALASMMTMDAWPVLIAAADNEILRMEITGGRQFLTKCMKLYPDRHDFTALYTASLLLGTMGGGLSWDPAARKWVPDKQSDDKLDPEKALPIITQAVTRAPNCAALHFQRGLCLELLKKPEAARAEYTWYVAHHGQEKFYKTRLKHIDDMSNRLKRR